jgi:hypothetical protein
LAALREILVKMVNTNCGNAHGSAGVQEFLSKSSCLLSLRSAMAASSAQDRESTSTSTRSERVPVDVVAGATGRTLVVFFATTILARACWSLQMNRTAIARLPAHVRLALIIAGLFALLGSFVAPAQAGYYGDPYYRPYPCSYRCGYPAYRPYNRCSWCGGYRRSVVYERRYIEREYVVRRYGYGGYRRPCGYYSYGGCYRGNGYYPYGGYEGDRRPWGYGYGGVGRRWPTFIGGYGAYRGYGGYAQGYEGPQPLEPVQDSGDYY